MVCGYSITSEHEPKILYCPNCKNTRENKFNVEETNAQTSVTTADKTKTKGKPEKTNISNCNSAVGVFEDRVKKCEVLLSNLREDFDKLLIVLDLKKKEKSV